MIITTPSEFLADITSLSSQTALTASVSFFGAQEAAQPWIDQFLALGPTKWQNQTIGWNNVSEASAFGTGGDACTRGAYNSHPSIGANQTSAATYTAVLNEFIDFMSIRPWFDGVMVVQRFNTTATLAVPVSKRGVYPGREIGTLM